MQIDSFCPDALREEKDLQNRIYKLGFVRTHSIFNTSTGFVPVNFIYCLLIVSLLVVYVCSSPNLIL